RLPSGGPGGRARAAVAGQPRTRLLLALNGPGPRRVCTLVAVSRCGDKVGAWLASYRRPLIGYVLPLVNGDVQAAEDVVQETMIKGWQHAEELHQKGAGSWLHTVARNLAIS